MRLVPAIFAVLLAGSIAAFADDAACPLPGKTPNPVMPTHTLPPYPPNSVRRFEQGQVLISVTINHDGIPGDPSVLRSSGSESLDNAATSFVKAHWRWQPFPVNCDPASAQLKILFSWHVFNNFPPKFDTSVTIPASQYPAGAVDRHENGETYLLLTLDDAGKVTDGRVIFSSGYTDLDEKALAVMRDTSALSHFPAGRQIVRAAWMPMTDGAAESVIVDAFRLGR